MMKISKGLIFTRTVRVFVGIGLVVLVAGSLERMRADGLAVPGSPIDWLFKR